MTLWIITTAPPVLMMGGSYAELEQEKCAAVKTLLGFGSYSDCTSTAKGMHMFKKFIRDESGATAIEYGLIAALIAVAAIASMELVGTGLDNTFDKVQAELNKKD